MNAWMEAGRMAHRYLGTSLPPQYLRRGDIVTGFHLEPVAVVEGPPVPHPTHNGWWVVESASAYGVGSHVMTDGETWSVGRVPLMTADTGPYSTLIGAWLAPCGCAVNRREHCADCGPYNGSSPLCMNTWQQRR